MKLIFAGTPAFAAEALAAIIAAGHEVALVLTQPDRPAGRGMALQPSAVKQVAMADRLLLTEIDRAYEGDAFFPDFDRSTWREASRDARTAESGLPFAFVTYERRS